MSSSPSSRKELPYPATRFERFVLGRKYWLIAVSFLAAFGITFLSQIYEANERAYMEQARPSIAKLHALGLAMYSFANDNDGKYPQGKSSTEVFQQLLDGGYLTDPSILYFRMDGKVVASETTKKLKPENVCWDVTEALTTKDAEDLPLIFMSGYKMDYTPNGAAHPLANAPLREGIAVYYISNLAKFIKAIEGHLPVIASTFDPKGKTYRQLTPDVPLP